MMMRKNTTACALRLKKKKGVETVLWKLIRALGFLFFLCIGICSVLGSLCSCRLCLWHIDWFFVCYGIVFVCNRRCSHNPEFSLYLGLAFEVNRH